MPEKGHFRFNPANLLTPVISSQCFSSVSNGQKYKGVLVVCYYFGKELGAHPNLPQNAGPRPVFPCSLGGTSKLVWDSNPSETHHQSQWTAKNVYLWSCASPKTWEKSLGGKVGLPRVHFPCLKPKCPKPMLVRMLMGALFYVSPRPPLQARPLRVLPRRLLRLVSARRREGCSVNLGLLRT